MMKTQSTNSNPAESEKLKKKERHMVAWTQEEDNILREQVKIHGHENWMIIASKFKDKTTRQCRRRWCTYLNSEFKKGVWSPEEDQLLCEAQKIHGNRWTEIAKVVTGRTDNAVKNRFATLRKKLAKNEASGKENINLNKRVVFQDGFVKNEVPLKRMRQSCTLNGCEIGRALHARPPFTLLAETANNIKAVSTSVLEGSDVRNDDRKRASSLENALNFFDANKENDHPCNDHREDYKKLFDKPVLPAVQEFSSPLQVTPLFRSLAAGIPSPEFSESERHFLMKTIGIESPAAPSKQPLCKRALINSL